MFLIQLLALTLLCATRSFATQPPDMPCDFYGYSAEGTILNVGDVITAKDSDGVECGSYTVNQTGQYGFLSCSGDDLNTPDIDEGAVEGDTITLFLNGDEVVNTGVWTKAGIVRIDIGDVLTTEEISVELHQHFNQICFSVMPEGLPTPYKASQLIQDMTQQGLNIHTVMQWDGEWISHQYDLFFTDFDLNLDEGIFVRTISDTYYAGTWTITGKQIRLPKVVNLRQGWNLVSIPTTISVNTTIEALEQINSQGGNADVMMWWDSQWVSTQVDLPFTNQELVKEGRGYFIRCYSHSTWEMQ